MEARTRILARVQRALKERPKALLPEHPHLPPPEDPVDLLLRRLQENGAEATRLPREEAKAFAQRLAQGLPGAAFGKTLPQDLRPPLPELPPEEAPLGVSWALFAVAETGSVALTPRLSGAWRGQLLERWHAARQAGGPAPAVTLEPDDRARLQALGYLGR